MKQYSQHMEERPWSLVLPNIPGNSPTKQRPGNVCKPLERNPMMRSPTKSELNPWAVFSANAQNMMTSSNGNIFGVTGPLCGKFTGPGEFPAQRPVTRSFDVFFDLRLNKRLSKQPWGWWFETPSWSLWRHRNENHGPGHSYVPFQLHCLETMIVWSIKWQDRHTRSISFSYGTTQATNTVSIANAIFVSPCLRK